MRESYDHQLELVLDALVAMTAEVRQAVNSATTALLTGDPAAAERVIVGDRLIDADREDIEAAACALLALQQPVATDLRTLVAALRMVAELERIGDHAVHVAETARRRAPASAVPEAMLPTITEMAHIADRMLGTVAEVIANRDPRGARRLDDDEEQMDALRRESFRRLLASTWAYGVATA